VWTVRSLDDHMHCSTGQRHGIDQCVRQNTLMVLTHLILNDMIKARAGDFHDPLQPDVQVKSMVVQVVAVLLDERQEMKALARRFFVELATKVRPVPLMTSLSVQGNELYNLLPEIISRISKDAVDRKQLPSGERMTQVKFEEVMTFLLSFITKEDKAAGLLERCAASLYRVHYLLDSVDDSVKWRMATQRRARRRSVSSTGRSRSAWRR